MLSTLIVAQASGPKGQLFCNTDSFIRIIDNIRAMTSCLSIGKINIPPATKATGAQIRSKTYYHTYIFKNHKQ